MNKVWNKVQKIEGKNNKTIVHHLKNGQDTLTSEQDISNKLGKHFQKTLLPKITIPNFKNIKSINKKLN
jgi:hypothetical protein